MYRDEFPSDCPLEDVVFNFHQLCARKLRGREFSPRLAFCIGELEQKKSRPVTKQDIRKSLAQLAKTHSIGKFVLIADNINEQ
uniref:Uncharacterized protein n=1 Tax=Caenorhabditis japonica TaxID=281687 RepID=A0A8R1E3R4_CAEJA